MSDDPPQATPLATLPLHELRGQAMRARRLATALGKMDPATPGLERYAEELEAKIARRSQQPQQP
jgi:hypothetical protein